MRLGARRPRVAKRMPWPMWVLAPLMFWAGVLTAQPATTTIADTVYLANGAPAGGTVLVSWAAFTTGAGQSVPKGSISVVLGSGGTLRVSLAPNSGATPMGSYYTAVYHLSDGSTSQEYWAVPASAAVQTLSAIRTSVLPASVAVQTVSKQYVDQAISNAALGVQPGSGAPSGTTAYVQRTGDTMTGALVLPGDPVSNLQAATKSYVDASAAAVQSGLQQKVSLLPAGTQTVVQPAGTQMQTNSLNGALYASGFLSQTGNDGIARAAGTADCASGCELQVERTYPGRDRTGVLPAQTHVQDHRGGSLGDVYFNPHSPFDGNDDAHRMTVTSTQNAAELARTYGRGTSDSHGLRILHNGLAGGNNIFPENITASVPYFKSTYSALALEGTYAAEGQHVLDNQVSHCYGVGDCLIGARFLYGSGGFRDNADEGTHPYDLLVSEDPNVFQGTCATGCTTGSTQLTVSATTAAGTQGEGRYLINKAPGKVIQAGTLVGGVRGAFPHATATFTGTSFAVSTFFSVVNAIPPQSNNMAPGTVTVAIRTTGATSGFQTNTVSAPAVNGVACVADALAGGSQGADNYETALYQVIDGTHIQLVLNKPHAAGATVAMGGLCGYGLEQSVDTTRGMRQVFPVVGSISATSLYYSGGPSAVVGGNYSTSGYFQGSFAISSAVRSGGTVAVTTAGALPVDLNGLTLTVSGVADSSYNGSFAVTTTGPNQFTYAQAGADSSSNGGTVAMVTGAYALYPIAEVLSVYNASTEAVDGTMTLSPNTVAWATGDSLEQPHYFQERVSADTEYVTQFTPRSTLVQSAGVEYGGVNGPGLRGWVIANASPPSLYFGNGGTHVAPDAGLQVNGIWSNSVQVQAGEQNAFVVGCNSHGCGRWNSPYNLFALQSGAGNGAQDTVNYAPNTSTLLFNLRGAQYGMSPAALTAPTVNATTLNVGTINAQNINVAGGGSGSGGGSCATTVAFSAAPAFAVGCANATFHMAMAGNVTSESFSGLQAGQRITLIFQTGSTGGYTVAWSAAVHGGFGTSTSAGSPLYMQPGRYFVQQLIVDTDGATLLNPGAINE